MNRHLANAVLAIGLAMAPCSAFAQPAPSMQAEESALALYNEGRKRLAAGDFKGALESLYASLEKLRAEGRGGSADAGLVAGFLAAAMEKLDHPQVAEAWRLSFELSERSTNPNRFIDAASGVLRRMATGGKAREADAVIERMMRRVNLEGVSDAVRLDALNVAVTYYLSADRKDDVESLLKEHAILLNGETPEALEMRGLARLRRAGDAFRAGKVSDFETEIEAALADIRRTLPKSARDLGSALMLSAAMRMKEGVYARVLSDVTEAATVYEEINLQERLQEANILKVRVLERVGRGREALSLAREVSARYHGSGPKDENLAALMRLLVIEMLAANRMTEEARELVSQERPRLSTLEDKLPLGLFHDRLAELDLLENNFAGAVKNAELAINTIKVARPGEKALLLEAMRKRADASEGLRDRDYGERAHRELIELSAELFHDFHPEFARDLDAYAGYLSTQGRRAEAFDLRRRSIAALERAYGMDGVKVAFALNNMATLLSAMGYSEEAASALRRALKILGDASEYAARRIMLRVNLANALIDLDRANEAMAELQAARNEKPGSEAGLGRLIAAIDMMELLALDSMERIAEAYRKGEVIVASVTAVERSDASNMVAIHLKMAQLAQKLGDDQQALKAAASGASLLVTEGIETDARWRAIAETTLPSLWRLGGD